MTIQGRIAWAIIIVCLMLGAGVSSVYASDGDHKRQLTVTVDSGTLTVEWPSVPAAAVYEVLIHQYGDGGEILHMRHHSWGFSFHTLYKVTVNIHPDTTTYRAVVKARTHTLSPKHTMRASGILKVQPWLANGIVEYLLSGDPDPLIRERILTALRALTQ